MFFKVLAFLFAFPAFAYHSVELYLNIQRETIRDTDGPLQVANTGKVFIKYDASGVCYLVGKNFDYPCFTALTDKGREVQVRGDVFAQFFGQEFFWGMSGYQGEFAAISRDFKDTVIFTSNYADWDPKTMMLTPVAIHNGDGKITYTIY